MKIEWSLEVYDLYEKFVNSCILSSKGLFTPEDKKNDFSIEALQEVAKRFAENEIIGSDKNFNQKIQEQFDGASERVRYAFAHLEWFWAMPANDITYDTKAAVTVKLNLPKVSDKFIPPRGLGSAGQRHKTNKFNEIVFLLYTFLYLKERVKDGKISSKQEVDKEFEKVCRFYLLGREEYGPLEQIKKNTEEKAYAACNLLLHLANPDYYEAIASSSDKKSIQYAFQSLLPIEDKISDEQVRAKVEEFGEVGLDDNIFIIRKELEEHKGKGFWFYDETLASIWKQEGSGDNYEVQALQFKKAIILHGPPGTGKTFTAQKLANQFITHHFLKKNKNVKRYFENGLEDIEKRVHYFQFNPNTSYEDFIAGYQLVNKETIARPGYLLDIIKLTEEEHEFTDDKNSLRLPHVLILDEINRVDLSRAFGEFFSAMEYRGKEINTAVKGLSICVPENLYIIGTMNEIDFSVERMDFALRRRFVWFFRGFDSLALKEILNPGLKKSNLEEYMDEYMESCSKLNDYIINEIEELGESYQIGHAFFTDLVGIYKENKALTGSRRSRSKLFKEAKKILWNISIKPMIQAFLGNTDVVTQKEYLEEAAKRFGVNG